MLVLFETTLRMLIDILFLAVHKRLLSASILINWRIKETTEVFVELDTATTINMFNNPASAIVDVEFDWDVRRIEYS